MLRVITSKVFKKSLPYARIVWTASNIFLDRSSEALGKSLKKELEEKTKTISGQLKINTVKQ